MCVVWIMMTLLCGKIAIVVVVLFVVLMCTSAQQTLRSYVYELTMPMPGDYNCTKPTFNLSKIAAMTSVVYNATVGCAYAQNHPYSYDFHAIMCGNDRSSERCPAQYYNMLCVYRYSDASLADLDGASVRITVWMM